MTATRTITIEVPASWYAGEDRYGDSEAWAHMPSRSLGDEPVRDAEIAALVVAALPRMQWAVMGPSGDEIIPVASEAQAHVLAHVRSQGQPDPAVVLHRLDDDADWADNCGLTYRDPLDEGIVCDLMADGRALGTLADAARWVESGEDPDAADHYAALRREDRAHGYDLADLEG